MPHRGRKIQDSRSAASTLSQSAAFSESVEGMRDSEAALLPFKPRACTECVVISGDNA
jgi:hypothetical protein